MLKVHESYFAQASNVALMQAIAQVKKPEADAAPQAHARVELPERDRS